MNTLILRKTKHGCYTEFSGTTIDDDTLSSAEAAFTLDYYDNADEMIEDAIEDTLKTHGLSKENVKIIIDY